MSHIPIGLDGRGKGKQKRESFRARVSCDCIEVCGKQPTIWYRFLSIAQFPLILFLFSNPPTLVFTSFPLTCASFPSLAFANPPFPHRVSYPGADEREGQDHPWATGLSVAEEGGGEAVLSLFQASNHLHQGFWRKASPHQGGPPLPS